MSTAREHGSARAERDAQAREPSSGSPGHRNKTAHRRTGLGQIYRRRRAASGCRGTAVRRARTDKGRWRRDRKHD